MPRTKVTARSPSMVKAFRAKAEAARVDKKGRIQPKRGVVPKPAAVAAAVAAHTMELGNGGELCRMLHKITASAQGRFVRVRSATGDVDIEELPAVLDKLDEMAVLVQRAHVKKTFAEEKFPTFTPEGTELTYHISQTLGPGKYDPRQEPQFEIFCEEIADPSEKCVVKTTPEGTEVNLCGYGTLVFYGVRSKEGYSWVFRPSNNCDSRINVIGGILD